MPFTFRCFSTLFFISSIKTVANIGANKTRYKEKCLVGHSPPLQDDTATKLRTPQAILKVEI
jgi:hypothetical protein